MPTFKFIISILFLILVASFAVNNMNSVPVVYYDYKLETHTLQLPLMVVIIIPFILGFILAWIMGIFSKLKLKSSVMKKNRALESMQEEMDRVMPHSSDADSPPVVKGR
ncbi:MAG: lipopolysaccharide assembly LapA domain-containing protein [Nitrospinaceae bacterium]